MTPVSPCLAAVALLFTLLPLSPSLAKEAAAPLTPGGTYNVRDYGAKGDGTTKDTAAFEQALMACHLAGGGTVQVPAGNYCIGSIALWSQTDLHLEKDATITGSADLVDYPLSSARWEGLERPAYRALITADHASRIAITGAGTIQGSGTVGKLRRPRGPVLIETVECRGVKIDGLTLKNDSVWTLHPNFCTDVTISNIQFQTVGSNSDGIDPDSCSKMLIENCTFTTGDDNIAIKSGKGLEGQEIGRPSEDITIRGCKFINGHAGVALGSELSGGIRNIRIEKCEFGEGRAALYIKTCAGRGAYVENITLRDSLIHCKALEIRTDYKANPDNQGIPGEAGLTWVNGIRLENLKLDGKGILDVYGVPEKRVSDLTAINITGTSPKPITLRNTRNVTLREIHVTGFTGPLVQHGDPKEK
ncbi:MAG: glycoside hydrolase family 28 protein [Chthoniobacteraceae bacterium]